MQPDRSFTPSVQVSQQGSSLSEISAMVKVEMDKVRELITAEQFATFESRLDVMHAAELLSDDEMFKIEDLCADFLEIKTTAGVLTLESVYSNPDGVAARLAKLIGVSEGIASDARCARQLRRKLK